MANRPMRLLPTLVAASLAGDTRAQTVSNPILLYAAPPGRWCAEASISISATDANKSVAAWIEANAGEIKTLTGKLSASADNHFLPSVESLKVVKNPYLLREDGLVERADCAQ